MDRSSRTAEEGLPRWEQGAVVVEMGVVELLLLLFFISAFILLVLRSLSWLCINIISPCCCCCSLLYVFFRSIC